MELPVNPFKQALLAGRQQIGLWNTIRDPYVVEMLAGLGYDWMLIDCEHTPRDLDNVITCLQALAPYETEPMVRVVQNDAGEIKRLLDAGVRNLLVPYVQSVAEAEAAARAVAYPPKGIRGMGGSTRANRFGAITGYAEKARDGIFLAVQIESVEAMDQLEDIAAVDGVDGIFIGPSDLAASMGFNGDPTHPKVLEMVDAAMGRIRAAGLPAGFLSIRDEIATRAITAGSLFTAVEIDSLALKTAVTKRRDDWRD